MLNLEMPFRQDMVLQVAVLKARKASTDYILMSWATTDLANVHLNCCPLDLERLDRLGWEDKVEPTDLVAELRMFDVCLDRPNGILNRTGVTYTPRFAVHRNAYLEYGISK